MPASSRPARLLTLAVAVTTVSLFAPSPPAVAAGSTLEVAVDSDPGSVARAGQSVTYRVHVTNTGDAAVADLSVSLVAPNLHAPSCTPVAQGGTLAAGGSTTCSASRTSTAEDLRNHGRTATATAAGFAPEGTPVSASATVRTTVSSLAPQVVDDARTVLANTGPVVLAGSTNDLPGETGGPAIDGSRTELPPTSGTGPATKARTTGHGTFLVLADGSIRYAVTPSNPFFPYTAGWTDTVPYRTYDAAGRSTVGSASVVVRRPPVAVADSLSIGRGQPVTVDPLANDTPGELLDGRDATFGESSLRFVAHQGGPGTVNDAGDVKTLPNAGVFTLVDGRVTFTPDARSAEPVGVQYSVTDSSGVTAIGSITVRVDAPTPTVTHDVATTTFATPVQLPGVLDDTPAGAGHTVAFGGFIGRDSVTNLGPAVRTPQGSWSLAADGRVVFAPAWGFSGKAVQYYLARDSGGGETVSALTATVRPGPTARPDTLAVRAGTDGSADPSANDVPGLRADGTPGTFDPQWAVFPEQGQPDGAVVGDHGKTLVLPGRGRLWFSDGIVTFRPQSGFRGFAGAVAYQVEDTSRPAPQRSIAVVGQLSVLVTSDALTATDDAATTTKDRPVSLPAATNDDPGTTATPLRPTFPEAGQPDGSVRSPDGLTVTVPGQGTWTATGDSAAVTFAPAPTYAGTTSPVTYAITGAGGATATARLRVTVAAGALANPDAVTVPEDAAEVDPLLNDVPGRSADGTLGTFELTSVRFPADGQPPGAVVGNSGRTLSIPARGSLPSFTASAGPENGLIEVTPGATFHGTTPAIAYGVISDVTDATGAVTQQYTRSTLRLSITGGDIVATDDHVVSRAGQVASLPGASNDSPAPGFFPLDFDGMAFPTEGQPPGSEIRNDPHGHDNVFSLIVPDEGTWVIEGGGSLAFTPLPGYFGDTSPIRYAISDFAGIHSAIATETVTVLPPAVPRADAATTSQGAPVTIRTLANDTAERDALGRPYDVAGTVTFDPSRRPSGSTLTPGSGNTQLVVPGQGTYTIDQGNGDVRFVPVLAYRDAASAFYLRVPGGGSRFQVTLTGVDPVARDDTATTHTGEAVRVRLLDNDAPGAAARPLVPASVRLRLTDGLPAGSALSSDRQTLAVPGWGTFVVAGDGTATFSPLVGVTGTVPTVGYTVADVNGTTAAARIDVVVR